MIVGDRLRRTADRLASFVSDYLRTMNRGAVLKYAKAPIISVVDLVHSEKAAQGHDVIFAGWIDADRDEGNCDNKSGLRRIAEKNNRNSGERKHGSCEESIAIVEGRAAKAGAQQKDSGHGRHRPEPAVELRPRRRRKRPEPAIERLPYVLRKGAAEHCQHGKDRVSRAP